MESESRLRGLIQLIPPARTLRDDLEQSLHLETYGGLGDTALGTLEGLRASIARVSDDPFVATLMVTTKDTATDKEKVALARLTAGQLVAYLEGQTGVPSSSGGGGGNNINIQKAPVINLNRVSGMSSDTLERLIGLATKHSDEDEDDV